MKFLSAFLGILIILVQFVNVLATRLLHLGGLVPMSGSRSEMQSEKGLVVLPAIFMALKEINQRSDILTGYNIKLHFNNTKCSPGYGSRVLFDMIDRQPTKVALLGPGCSSVSERLVDVSSTWNLIMVTYSKPTFSATQNTKRNFFTTMTSDTALNDACVALLIEFKWSQVALIRQQGIVYSRAFNDLEEKLRNTGITVMTSETFRNKPAGHVKEIKAKQARIIIGKFDERSARKVFCQAYKSGQYGKKYAWILLGGRHDDWWKKRDSDVTCSPQQLSAAVDGSIVLSSLGLRLDRDTKTVSDMTSNQFIHKYEKENKKLASNDDAGFAYDATWALALALNQSQAVLSRHHNSLSNFRYNDSKISNTIRDALQENTFEGVTGLVNFTSNGERVGYIRIDQIQGKERKLVCVYVAHNHTIVKTPGFSWSDDKPPVDHPQVKIVFMAISPALYGVMVAISVICILVALGFLVFNIKFSNCKYLKMSSPRLNDAILIGIILMYFSVFLLGLDSSVISTAHVGPICQARVWLSSLGFTIAFGAMFAKTWRVYVIFTNAKLRKRVIHDEKLFVMVGFLALIDIIILSLWSGFDPLKRELQNGTLKHGTDMDEIQQWELCECSYYNVWRGIIYTYKGLLLVFGLFLAWETRHVNIPALNDSHYIGMSVYNVVLLSVIGVPLSLVIRNNQNGSFALAALVVLYCTTATLCLVFVPKLIAVKRDPDILNSFGGTSAGTSQGGAESSASQDRAIGGPKFIALTAENANLKKHIQEKEEQIASFESRLCKAGVPPDRVKKIAQAFQTSTNTNLAPSMGAFGEARESIHIELDKNDTKKHMENERKRDIEAKDGSKEVHRNRRNDDIAGNVIEARKVEDMSTPRQRYSSSSKMDTRAHQKQDLSKKYSLPSHKYISPGGTHDVNANTSKSSIRTYDVIGCHDNPTVNDDVRDDRKYVRTDRAPSLSHRTPTEGRPPRSPRDWYKGVGFTSPGRGESQPQDNAGEEGKVVLSSKLSKGEACFQLKMTRPGSVLDNNAHTGTAGLVEYNFQDVQDV